jgi:DNA-binding transcriptional ArsR family regulator
MKMVGQMKNVPEEVLLRLRGEGKTLKMISAEMGVSIPTLSRRLAVLRHEKGLLTQYRQLQRLRLTELQARMLAAIDMDHIEKASLGDIANAVNVITKVRKSIQGKDSFKVRGLMDYLLALERHD